MTFHTKRKTSLFKMNLLHPFSIITSPAPRAVTDVITFPSHPRLMVGFHLGQVTSLSQGHIETNFYAHSHTYSSTLCCLSVYCNMHVFGLRHSQNTWREPTEKNPKLGNQNHNLLAERQQCKFCVYNKLYIHLK